MTTRMKTASTFFIILFISCYVAQGRRGGRHNPPQLHFKVTTRSAINVHSKTSSVTSPPSEMNYNETMMKQILAQSGVTSTSWDEFNVYVAPQHGLKAADKIENLPGQPKVNFNQYSGYVTVDGRAGRALFYYFVESNENPSAKPLVLWLNGGPGCSSLLGAMVELGPFRVKRDQKTLAVNPYAWNKLANIVFLESPAGVGFSYSNTTSNYDIAGDKTAAQDSYTFLINWLERFPEYKSRDFYITGESYAGHYIPQLAKLILQKNRKTTRDRVINLRGIAVGNGIIDELCQHKGRYDFLYKHAIISKDLRNTLVMCNLGLGSPEPSSQGLSESKCSGASTTLDARLETINLYALNVKTCNLSSNTQTSTQYDPCNEEYTKAYMNMPQVQEALGAKLTKWETCSKKLPKFEWNDHEPTIMLTIKELMETGLRIWLYSGDIDGVVPVEGTEYAIKGMGFSIKTNRYPWYNAPNEVGGYATEYHNLTFVTVKDSGHLVPSFQPARALMIFSSFLQGKLPPAAKS